MNIPIYRAKKIGSDEYIIGYYTEKVKEYPGKHYIHFNNGYTETYERIDPTTLAIHFPDTNIEDLFFGLDNGLGASIIEAVFVDDISPFKGIAMHSHYGYVFFDKNNDWVHINKLKDIKVIGIHKWE